MSNEKYSPVAYNKYFSTNKLNINTFFTKLIELIIYVSLLKKYMSLLNVDNIQEYLKYLRPILQYIKFLFNIELDEQYIKMKYDEKDNDPKYENEIDEYICVFSFSSDDKPIDSMDLNLDDIVEDFAVDFDKKKNSMEAIFIQASREKED